MTNAESQFPFSFNTRTPPRLRRVRSFNTRQAHEVCLRRTLTNAGHLIDAVCQRYSGCRPAAFPDAEMFAYCQFNPSKTRFQSGRAGSS
ncbi:MAG TPA: hypothetical protein VF658_11580 [Pyrinomonadaceae bacterium]